nr:meiotic nuclear division protein 1 [Hymenolepis microstoma]
MSRKRGLSLDEKREKMIEFFYEKKDFYTLKELERLCHKEKGIPSMTVKDVLMSLVFDGLVDSDKIGTSTYFWAFPSKAGQNRRKKIDVLQAEASQLESRYCELEDALTKARTSKKDTAERQQAISSLSSNQLILEKLKVDFSNLQHYHPSRLEKLKSQSDSAIDSANRWTGISPWIKNKFGVDESLLRKQFQIPENFDYIDN